LLADGDVDATHLFAGVARVPVGLLVDDRVDTDSRLTGLTVTDEQLTLPATDRSHGVDRLDTGLEGFLDRRSLHRRVVLESQVAPPRAFDLALAVDGGAEGVHHAAHEVVTDRDREDLAGAAHLLALIDTGEVAQHHDTDLADLEVLGHTQRAVLELKQLVRHRRGKATDAGNTVTGVGDGTDLFRAGGVRLVRLDEAL